MNYIRHPFSELILAASGKPARRAHPNLQALKAFIVDYADQDGYLTTLHLGSHEVSARFVLTPWMATAAPAVKVLGRLTSSMQSCWGQSVIIHEPTVGPWQRLDVVLRMGTPEEFYEIPFSFSPYIQAGR